MSEWATRLISLSLVAIELFTYCFLADVFFIPKGGKLNRTYVILLFFAAEYVLVQYCAVMLLRIGVTVLWYALLMGLIYRAKSIHCLFTSLLWTSFLGIFDVIALYGFTIATGQSLLELQESPPLYVLMAYLSKTLGLTAVVLIHVWGTAHFQKRPQRIGSYLRFGLYPVATLVCALLMFLAAVKAPEIASSLLFCLFFLLATDLLFIAMMQRFETQQEELKNLSILQKELDSAMDNIAAARQSYDNERRMTHDFENQLIVIRGMLTDSADYQEIIAYLNQIDTYIGSVSLRVCTNRIAADVLLNQKYILATQKGIAFQVRLDDLSAFPLPDNALVVLLSNLLDNAIEACCKIFDSKQRRILIKMSVGPNECILCVENTVAAPVRIEDNRIKTTKPDPEQHGYGLKNIAAIVNTYDGYYTMNCDEKRFQFISIFPGPQAKRF